MKNIHASCVSYLNKGILIRGKSGLGKSDLCLRLIMDKGCRLVGDDRVDIYTKSGALKARSVATISNMLEVRGIGLMKFEAQKSATVKLVVELVKDSSTIERLPDEEFFEYEEAKVKKIRLCAFEASAVDKVILALSAV